VLCGVVLAAACSTGQGNGNEPVAPGPAAVTVITVQPQAVPLSTELPGRTAPYLVAEVRPQVSGIVEQRLFEEGSEVEAGQILYRIDPATYQAAYDSARAGLARAQANLHAVQLKARRYAELIGSKAISAQDNDEAQAALGQARADVSAAQAAVDKARVDLDYTRVTAPIAGRIGRSAVTAGALVTANQAAALATIQQLDPIYVDVTQSSADRLRLRRDLDAGRLQRGTDEHLPVSLVLEDDSEYARNGRLAFSEVAVDRATGTVTLRAVFPNPEGELLPGMYVRARLAQGVQRDAILIPHAALSRDPRGNAVVMLVGAQDKVEARTVTAARAQGGHWVVSDGLAGGERVIVEGLQHARPGDVVVAHEAAKVGAKRLASGK